VQPGGLLPEAASFGVAPRAGAAPGSRWQLRLLHFYTPGGGGKGTVGTMMCDTGADVTIVSQDFVRRAGLRVRPAPAGSQTEVRMIDNRRLPVLGRADVPLQIQLMLDVSEGPGEECLVHWDRHLMLRDVWVVGMGESSPRDLYVSYADWAYDPSKPQPAAPLASLAYMVAAGARVIDAPRPPLPSEQVEELEVVTAVNEAGDLAFIGAADSAVKELLAGARSEAGGAAAVAGVADLGAAQGDAGGAAGARSGLFGAAAEAGVAASHVAGIGSAAGSAAGIGSGAGIGIEGVSVAGARRSGAAAGAGDPALPVVAGLEVPGGASLSDRIRRRVHESFKGSATEERLLEGLLWRSKAFGPLVAAECTEVVDFELVSLHAVGCGPAVPGV